MQLSDLSDATALERAMTGVRSVVHLAARVHVMHETSPDALAAFRATNVAGTRAVCEAARSAAVERFLYVSTIKVNGDGRARPYTETDHIAPTGPHAVSKAEAEAIVQDLGDAHPRWTILRPPLVYGESVGGNFNRFLRVADLSRRIPLPFGSVRNQRSMVYVGNLVDSIIRCLDADSAAQCTFLVSDDNALSTPDLIRCLASHLGGKARLFPFPISLLKGALTLAGRGSEAQRLLESLTVDSSAIRSALGWKPPFSVDEGLRLTAAWWNGHA